ncbi:MAG: tetratricopeptide repeat protein [Bacteroidetes bacterium]|nr:MAG: tetratricopeptide repeat protein [Bacteroidota bacterium]
MLASIVMRHNISNILFTIFLYSCTSFGDYLQKADTAIEKEDYREAINFLNKALSKKKYLAEAYSEKAHCYTKLNKDDSAIIVYEQLLVFDPNNTLAFYNLGLCKYRQEKFDEAIDYFNDAMKTKGYNPNDTSKSQLIMEYTQGGKELLGMDGKFDISFSEIFYMAGLVYYKTGKIKKAYRYFMDCISKGFNVPESHYMIGLCWLSAGDNQKACESFKTSQISGYALAIEQFEKNCK